MADQLSSGTISSQFWGGDQLSSGTISSQFWGAGLVARLEELNKEPVPTMEQLSRQMGSDFYSDRSNICDQDEISLKARTLAHGVSQSVVGVSCHTPEDCFPNVCSGIMIEFDGEPTVLTSAYVLGDHAGDDHFTFPIKVYLDGNVIVAGSLVFVDQHYNIALIHPVTDQKLPTASLQGKTAITKLDNNVVAVGRFCRGSESRLVASHGKIIGRNDRLECEDLLASSCCTPEWGIGAPLVDPSGHIAGMSFYGGDSATPFLPSSLLLICMEHFKKHGEVIHRTLGIKTRSLYDLPLKELEAVYVESSILAGVLVKEVKMGSPAHNAGIAAGDIIIQCNKTRVDYPFQVAAELLHVGHTRAAKGVTHALFRKARFIPSKVQLEVYSRSTSLTESKLLDAQISKPSGDGGDDISCWSVRAL